MESRLRPRGGDASRRPVRRSRVRRPAPPRLLPPARQLALRLAADSLLSAGAADSAITAYERLLAADSTDYEATWRLAQALRRARPHGRGGRLGLRAWRAGFADREGTLCEIARWHAADGRTDEALAWLERCVAAPMIERPELKTDEAFAALRDDPRFRALAGFGAADDTADRVAGWREDLAFFVAEARRMHAAPARPTHDPAFAAEVEALAAARAATSTTWRSRSSCRRSS